jgi:hypothetical protein
MRKHRPSRSIPIARLLIAAIALGAPFLAVAAEAPDLPAIMRLTADYWIASELDGFLPYGYDFLADKPLEPGRMSAPNLVRQAATAFAVARYYEFSRDDRLRAPLGRALSALNAKSIPIGKGKVQRALESTRILSLPVARWKLQTALDRVGLLYQSSGDGKVPSARGDYLDAFAGGGALALLSELAYASASGDESFAAARRAWLEGLLALRIPGGGFRHAPALIDDTDYDNGEGWLALAVYVDRHPDDPQVAAELADLDKVMIARYAEAPTMAFFGWGAMSAAQRFVTTHDPRFLAYLRRQGELFVERLAPKALPEDNNCAPLEGVAAMLGVLVASGDRDSRRVRDLQSWASREIGKLPRLQIQPGQEGMTLGGEAYLRAPQMASFAGGFVWNLYEPTARVDAAGHCLSAMVTLERAQLH